MRSKQDSEPGQYGLDRALGPWRATALVIGSVVGSGIFVSSASMARALGPTATGSSLLAAWMLAGAMTLLGALTQGELASRLPVTGGLYSYFRHVFGDALGFFYGWANFMIAGSGAIAAVSFVFASCVAELIAPLGSLSEKTIGLAAIVTLTALNTRGLSLGTRVQSAMAAGKSITIVVLIASAAYIAPVSTFSTEASTRGLEAGSLWSSLVSLRTSGVGISGWLAALSGAFWAFDGWGNPTTLGGEIRNPRRNLPFALLVGLALVTALYLVVNIAYLKVLTLGAIASAPGDRVASLAAVTAIGQKGAAVVTALIALSTLDALNAAIIANSRVSVAMARDGLFWGRAGKVSPATRAPVTALVLQGAWSAVLLLTGSFGALIGMYVFVNWLFYLLIPLALLVLRRRERARPGADARAIFAMPAYPVVPLLFAALTIAFLVRNAQADGAHCLLGLALVASGAPLFLYLRCFPREL